MSNIRYFNLTFIASHDIRGNVTIISEDGKFPNRKNTKEQIEKDFSCSKVLFTNIIEFKSESDYTQWIK